jgi:hypothetical protein
MSPGSSANKTLMHQMHKTRLLNREIYAELFQHAAFGGIRERLSRHSTDLLSFLQMLHITMRLWMQLPTSLRSTCLLLYRDSYDAGVDADVNEIRINANFRVQTTKENAASARLN